MGYTLAVLGCGTMGIAVLSGVLSSLDTRLASGLNGPHDPSPSGISTPTASGFLDAPDDVLPSRFFATVGREETVRKLRKTFSGTGSLGHEVDVRTREGSVDAAKEADVVLISVKPNVAKETLCLPGMKEALAGKLLISICGGVTISQMRTWLDESTLIVRAMPNVASKASPSTFLQSPGTDFGQIREGMTVITPVADAHRRALILAIFTSCGRARILEEKHFDACTALAGSGPAFVALVLEAMVDGGVMMGLPRVEAMEIAAQTLQGTGRMALQTGMHPAQLKDSVTTPAGCTIAGLLTMEDGRVRSTIARTIQVATNHAAGLGQEKK